MNKKAGSESFTSLDEKLMTELFSHLAIVMLTVVRQWQASHLDEQMRCLLSATKDIMNIMRETQSDIPTLVNSFMRHSNINPLTLILIVTLILTLTPS